MFLHLEAENKVKKHWKHYHMKYNKTSCVASLCMSMTSSPGHTDAWIQVVEFGGAQGDLFVLLSVCSLNLHIQQLFFTPLHSFLLLFHNPEHTYNAFMMWIIIIYKRILIAGRAYKWGLERDTDTSSLLSVLPLASFLACFSSFLAKYSCSFLLSILKKRREKNQT